MISSAVYIGQRHSRPINWSNDRIAITQECTLLHENYQSFKYSDTLLNHRSNLENNNPIKPGIKFENVIDNYLK